MNWSKLYGRWRSEHLDERLLKRVNISRSLYRKSFDSAMNIYVRVDKVTVLMHQMYRGNPFPKSPFPLDAIVIGDSLDNLLASEDPRLRRLAYLDKRFGKSRILEKLIMETDEFARDCLRLKMSLYPDMEKYRYWDKQTQIASVPVHSPL